MGYNVDEMVGITLDAEVKPPATIYTSLPDVACFVVLLGVKGSVSKVSQEVTKLLAKIAHDPVRGIAKRSGEPF